METSTRDFHHPYKPYDIQIQLMNAIYDCIAEGKVGIFESPTGPSGMVLSYLSPLTDVDIQELASP